MISVIKYIYNTVHKPVSCHNTTIKMCRKHGHGHSIASFVNKYCSIELSEVKSIYDCMEGKLRTSLIGSTLHNFPIDDILFCGSFSEGTRIKDPNDKRVEIEFDILALSSYPAGSYADKDAGTELRRFMTAVKEKLIKQHSSFYGSKPGDGGYEYLLYRCNHSAGYDVLIDIHPAISRDVYVIPLDSFWRTSYVKKELERIRNSHHHILPFRILKYTRSLVEDRLRYSKYALKTAVLEHIGRCTSHNQKECTVDILDILYQGYKHKDLKNVFSDQNVVERHDNNPFTVTRIERMRNVLSQDFDCAQCVIEQLAG